MSFNPVVRFAVLSDAHYSVDMLYVRDRFKRAVETAYKYAEGEEYNRLDAIYVVGDFTNRGRSEEYKMFKDDCDLVIKKDTKLVVTMANHELHYVDDYKDSLADFKRFFNMDYDRHEIINGYHFISLSTIRDKGPWDDSFNNQKKLFLKNELEKARNDGGNRPIFVFQHPGIAGTVVGGSFGNNEIHSILSEFPQVIDFSGHSHYPANSPHEIQQRHFTAKSTGAILSIINPSLRAYTYMSENGENPEENAQMLIVEADDKMNVKIRVLDVIAGDFFENDIMLEKCWDNTKYKYTRARAKTAPVPYFKDNASGISERNEENINLTFDRAYCDRERVKEYLIRVEDKNGVIINQKTISSDFHTLVQKERICVSFKNIEKGNITFKIYACGFWDNYSLPLVVRGN